MGIFSPDDPRAENTVGACTNEGRVRKLSLVRSFGILRDQTITHSAPLLIHPFHPEFNKSLPVSCYRIITQKLAHDIDASIYFFLLHNNSYETYFF